ncbi:MAG: hypothetical protein H7Z73_01540 [Candidatus Saccharibacteria bacterium]|nr:hypothetical protein [Moraxellaceae bacterium]
MNVERLNGLNYEEAQLHIEEIDHECVEKYNKRRLENSTYKLQVNMRPCPFEGDIKNSRVILLLANPGYDDSSSINDHHRNVSYSEWPFFGLHDESPSGMRDWWRLRLDRLRQNLSVDWQFMSKNIAAIQMNPWASTKFDSSAKLASRDFMFEIARDCAKRDALFVVMRARKHWDSALKGYEDNLIYTNSCRCSYLTEGNLRKEDWSRIIKSIS